MSPVQLLQQPRTNLTVVSDTSSIHKHSSRIIDSAIVCMLIVAIALVASQECRHWFVIPLFFCGLLCCVDAVRLFENRGRDLFRPVPMLGAFGVYFFLISPLLHVALDFWFISERFATGTEPDDWRPWLGAMGCINLAGLMIYRYFRRRSTAKAFRSRAPRLYRLDPQSLRVFGPMLLIISCCAQIYIYAKFGGISGFVSAFENSHTTRPAFEGLGWIMCIGESFPVLLLVVWVARFRGVMRNWGLIKTTTVIALMFVVIMFFGGLRGSRGNTIFAVLYAVGIIHLTLRRLTWRMLATLAAVLTLFMYVYGFFKVNTQTFLTALSSVDSMIGEGERTGRTIDGVLLGDLERSDIQAFTLFQMWKDGNDVDLAYGQTYIASVLAFVPHFILPDRPPGKLRYGTDVFFGRGSYDQGMTSTKIYGLAGEAMLNWGPLSALAAFALLGWFVGRAEGFGYRILPSDPRQFMLPILSITCIVLLSSDLDNVLYVLLRHALMPGLLLWLCSDVPSRAAARSDSFRVLVTKP